MVLPLTRPKSAFCSCRSVTKALIGFLLVFAASLSSANQLPQVGNDSVRELAFFDDVSIVLDGTLNESVWEQVQVHSEMRVISPSTLEEPRFRTETRMFYTPRGLYVGARLEQPRATLVARLSARDRYISRDSFGITLDPSGEGHYGYWFETTVGGSVMDGTVVAERTITEQWDGAWQSKTALTQDGWSVEMLLPWSMLAMPSADRYREIGVWLKREVAHVNETYSWPPLPSTEPVFLSGFESYRLQGVSPRQQVAVFPYLSSTMDDIADSTLQKLGMDLSYRPVPNVQLTGTLNPDFGAAESDKVVVNLTAYETFFPEKRLFFLEGSEVFFTTPRSDPNRYSSRRRGGGARQGQSSYLPEPTTLLNTRRIGGAARHIDIPDHLDIRDTERSKPTDLKGAVKLVATTGNLSVGTLAAVEEEVRLDATDTRNDSAPVTFVADGRKFGALRLRYELPGAGRKAIGYLGTVVDLLDETPAVHGIDTHFRSQNGTFNWDGQYIYSRADDTSGHGIFNDFSYVPRPGWYFSGGLDYFAEDLQINDFGYIQRSDLIDVQLGGSRMQFTGLENHRSIRTSLFFIGEWNTAGFSTRSRMYFSNSFEFLDASELRFSLSYGGPSWDDRSSRDNGMFKLPDQWSLNVNYGTDSAQVVSFSAALRLLTEHMGGVSTSGDLGMSATPNDRFTMNLDLRYSDQSNWLLHTEDRHLATFTTTSIQPILTTDLFFTARHHLRLTYQWAGYQAVANNHYSVPLHEGKLVPRLDPPAEGEDDFTVSRMTLQLRYRWEIRPLSDLFVVYTRGANLPSRQLPEPIEFADLFSDAFREPIVDVFLVKLRYRFGT